MNGSLLAMQGGGSPNTSCNSRMLSWGPMSPHKQSSLRGGRKLVRTMMAQMGVTM